MMNIVYNIKIEYNIVSFHYDLISKLDNKLYWYLINSLHEEGRIIFASELGGEIENELMEK